MAMRKAFRYGTLLRVRKRQEELKAVSLAAARRHLRNAEAERDELTGMRMGALLAAGERTSRPFAAPDLQRYYQYERHLARELVAKEAEIVQLARKEEFCRSELETAMKGRRTVERLEERHLETLRGELAKADQRHLDEVAVSRQARKSGLGARP